MFLSKFILAKYFDRTPTRKIKAINPEDLKCFDCKNDSMLVEMA
jgi:hypothetical protein